MSYERQVNLDDEAVKMRILTFLKDRDLNNHDIRQMTGWNRKKVHQIIKELEPSGNQIRPVEFAPGFLSSSLDDGQDVLVRRKPQDVAF
jgi:hypothetical protein